ncbi:hypothetical protein H4219_002404 [Mycoemilia scoparia]|uniref:Vacuolar protein 14 C-terminal Fig4-binding domain-containing protein n=1 Tax=Mycoemilia scoparia TaxID=417184 RepID=A0A9W8DUU6_9FUNG|nr:hypothetical protein H4219_002404 [Mycoemilia scoparia]
MPEVNNTLPAAVAQDLSHRDYERRMKAAEEVEKIIQQALKDEDHDKVESTVTFLTRRYVASDKVQDRLGGIAGFAKCAVTLNVFHLPRFLPHIVPPIINLLSDPEPRVKFYTCEALYNVMKVAKGHILQWFSDIFDGLTLVMADTHTSVVKGGELVNKLLMDIVTEQASIYIRRNAIEGWNAAPTPSTSHVGGGYSRGDGDSIISAPQGSYRMDRGSISDAHGTPSVKQGYQSHFRHSAEFSLDEFIPLLANRLSAQKSQIRMYLIQWIRLFTEIRGFDLLAHLPSFLKGPLMFLDDKDASVRTEAHGALADLLREVQKASDSSRLTRPRNQVASYAEWIQKEELNSSQSQSISPNKVPGSNIDYSGCVKILLSHIGSDDQDTQKTALIWIHSFSWICPEVLVSQAPELIYAILPALPNPGSEIQHIAEEVNAVLFRLVDQSPSPKILYPQSSNKKYGKPQELGSSNVAVDQSQDQTAAYESASTNKSPVLAPVTQHIVNSSIKNVSAPPTAPQSLTASCTSTPCAHSPANSETLSKKLAAIPTSPLPKVTATPSAHQHIPEQNDGPKKRPIPLSIASDGNIANLQNQHAPNTISPVNSSFDAAHTDQPNKELPERVEPRSSSDPPEGLSTFSELPTSTSAQALQKYTSAFQTNQIEVLAQDSLGEQRIVEPFNYDNAVTALMERLESSTFEATKMAAMNWLLLLHQKAPWRILTLDDLSFKIILKLLTDPSEEIVKLNLLLIAKISLFSEGEAQEVEGSTQVAQPFDEVAHPSRKSASQLPISSSASPYLIKCLSALLRMFADDRPLLEKRAGLIIRQLCLVHDPQNLFLILADLLNPETATEYLDDFDPVEIRNISNRLFSNRMQSQDTLNPILARSTDIPLYGDNSIDDNAVMTAPAEVSNPRSNIGKLREIEQSPIVQSAPLNHDRTSALHTSTSRISPRTNSANANISSTSQTDPSNGFYQDIQKQQQNKSSSNQVPSAPGPADSSTDNQEQKLSVTDILQTGDIDDSLSDKSSQKKFSFSQEFVEIMLQHLTWILATSSETSALRSLLRNSSKKALEGPVPLSKTERNASATAEAEISSAPKNKTVPQEMPRRSSSSNTRDVVNASQANRSAAAEGHDQQTTGQIKRTGILKRTQSPRPPSHPGDNDISPNTGGGGGSGIRGRHSRGQSTTSQPSNPKDPKPTATSSTTNVSSIPRSRSTASPVPGSSGGGSNTNTNRVGNGVSTKSSLSPISESSLPSKNINTSSNENTLATSQPKSQDFFVTLYRTWIFSPVSTLILCFLSQQYELASEIMPVIADSPITVNTMVQLDKLVQLLESPIFSHLRISLLEPWRFPHLYKALYRIMLILPQSTAFATLRNRLNGVPIFTMPPFICPAFPSYNSAQNTSAGDGTSQQTGGNSQKAPQRAISPHKKDTKLRRSSLTSTGSKHDDNSNAKDQHQSQGQNPNRQQQIANKPHNVESDPAAYQQAFMLGYQYAYQQLSMQRQMTHVQFGHLEGGGRTSSSTMLSSLSPPSPTIPLEMAYDSLGGYFSGSSYRGGDDGRTQSSRLSELLDEFKQIQKKINSEAAVSNSQHQQQRSSYQQKASPSTSMTF